MKFKTRGAAKNLSLDTSTWPPKARSFDGKPEDIRPRTATLDKPLVLDIALLGHLDMTTLTRRGLLKVCRFPLGNNKNNKNNKINTTPQGKGVIGVLSVMTPAIANPDNQARKPGSRASSRSDLSGDEDNSSSLRGRHRRGATLVRQKKPIIEEDKESMWAEDNLGVVSDTERFGTFRVRRNNRLNRTYRIPGLSRGPRRQPLSVNNSININEYASHDEDDPGVAMTHRNVAGPGFPRRAAPARSPVEEVFGGPGLKESVPEPCRTCGRPELPERFHSHPKVPGPTKAPVNHHGFGHLPEAHHRPVLSKDPPAEVLVRKTVKKPVPIKYRPRRESGANAENGPPLGPIGGAAPRSPARPGAAARGAGLGPLGVTQFMDADGPGSPSRGRGPRTVTCYVCGREFGTASLPLHEPHCVQKWLIQNSKLPPQWQKQLPIKPVGLVSIDEWNKFASETSKSARSIMSKADEDMALVEYSEAEGTAKPDARRRLVPLASRMAYMEVLRTNWYHLKSDEYLGADSVQCPNCLRRFTPDRVNSHERVCFEKPLAPGVEPRPAPEHSAGGSRGSPLVECSLCGKKFGTRSIAIHEPQCLKKWQQVHGDRGPQGPGHAQPAIDKPREYPKLEAPVEPKPLAIEFPAQPRGQPQPAPHQQRSRSPERPERPRSAWAGEQGGLGQGRTPAPSDAPHKVASSGTPGSAGGAPLPRPRAAPSRPGRPLRCYLCGQMFGLQSLPIHEPQCLNKWRLANAKLPPHLQRPEPEKPEIIFTESGDVDYWGTFDRIWANHTGSLISCSFCGRRFFPDRIQIHERSCITNVPARR